MDAENLQKEQNGYAGDAIEYLGELENVYEEFEWRLEKYRTSGKQRTIIFRELMGKKVMIKIVLDVFREKCKYLKT